MKRTGQEYKTEIPTTPTDLQEQIRNRAYQIYEERGRADGFDLEDWLEAEAEILDARDLMTAA